MKLQILANDSQKFPYHIAFTSLFGHIAKWSVTGRIFPVWAKILSKNNYNKD